MTKQESFKRRVRARMAKTGERYAAARQALIDQSRRSNGRRWVSNPETSDAAVAQATGRSWNQWCDLIDDWIGDQPAPDHTTIAAYLADELGIDPWWSQSITGGYERITGLRLPYQRPDGTFTAGRSATIAVDGIELRRMLLDDGDRADLIPGFCSELRSRPDAKRIRIGLDHGVVQFSIEQAKPSPDRPDQLRYRVAISHEKLADFADVEPWKQYWQAWLDAVAAESSA
jgi:type II secretory pathway pseudopilin PulG